MDSAMVYADACRRLGRYRDAEMALAATFEIVEEKREEEEEEDERARERADRARAKGNAGNDAAADAEEDTHMLAAGAAAGMGAAAAQSADPASSDSAGASSGKSSATATDGSASAAAAGSSRSTLPPLLGTTDRARAQLLVALGSLALASNRHGDAARRLPLRRASSTLGAGPLGPDCAMPAAAFRPGMGTSTQIPT